MRRINPSPKYESTIPQIPSSNENENSKVTLGSLLPIPESFAEFSRGCQIISEGAIKPFELFEFQIELAKLILSGNYKTIYIIKSRQLGISLLIGCILAYKALKQEGFSAFTISLGQGESSKFGRRVKRFLDNWNGKFINDNTREHILENQSSISYYPNTSTIGRGDSVNYSVYDESAFYPLRTLKGASAASKIWGGSENTVSISLSTPSDKTSEFYELLSEGNSEPYQQIAERVVNGEYPPFYYWVDERGALKVVIHFTAVPKFKQNPNLYTDLLYEEGLTPDQIDRECNLKFSDTTGTTLDYTKVNKVFSLTSADFVDYPELKRNGWDIVCGFDPCGYGNDQAAFIIIAVHTRLHRIRICAEYYLDQPDYAEFESWFKDQVGTKTKATLLIESNGVGIAAIEYCLKHSDISLFHKVESYAASENTKLDTISFIKFLIENEMIEGMENLSVLSRQLKQYDLSEMKGTGSQKDDGVSALMHCLQFVNFQAWYRVKKGLSSTNQISSSQLVGMPLKSIYGSYSKPLPKNVYKFRFNG